MRELVSVIVPVYNVELYLKFCVESIIMQTYENLEIILVDDGSKDGSPHICDAFLNKDKRVRVIHQQNQGLSAARNAGIEVARKEIIHMTKATDNETANVGNTSLICSIVGYRIKPAE